MKMAPPMYYPWLPTADASALLADYSAMTVEKIAEGVEISLENVAWYPTGPAAQRVRAEALIDFRAEAVRLARRHGYPKSGSRGVAFDRDVVAVIPDLLPMLPAEAAVDSVWNFLSLRVAPDVALWRWPNPKNDPLYERIIGRPRNVFRRLWWRSYIFGTGIGSAALKLHEDEAVAIMERTLIGGNRRLSRCIAETHMARFEKREKRTEVLRDAMKRVRRLHGFLVFEALTSDELRAVVGALFDETERSLFETGSSARVLVDHAWPGGTMEQTAKNALTSNKRVAAD